MLRPSPLHKTTGNFVGTPEFRLFVFAGALAGASLLALAVVDIPASFFCLQGKVPKEIRKLLSFAEVFAYATGVLAILLTVSVLDPSNRAKIPRVAACAFLPGIVNLLLKVSVGRARPGSFLASGNVLLPTSGWETFVGWFHDPMNHRFQSFASGHTASAVGLAIGLAWLYPRGRWLFAGFACLAALQRVDVGAHFLSDTLAGAAVACMVGGFCVNRAGFGGYFAKIECKPETQ